VKTRAARRRSAGRTSSTSLATALLLAACAVSPPPPVSPPPVVAAAPRVPGGFLEDAASDWHSLLLMPFGTLLKTSPVPLHEVLLFSDEAHPRLPADGRECFAPNGAPPSLFGVKPDEYLLCFAADRLERIEASVTLASVDAGARFAHACRTWLQDAVPQAAVDGVCEGRGDGATLHARLSSPPGVGRATVSLTIIAAPVP